MTRKAAWFGLSFLAGTVLFLEAGGRFVFVAAAVAVIGVILSLTTKSYRAYATAAAAAVLCGGLCVRAYALLCIDPALKLDGETVTMTGTVTECKPTTGGRYILTVDGRAEGTKAKIVFFSDREAEPYEKVTVTGTVNAVEDTPKFSAWSYYAPKGIFLQGNADTLTPTGEYGNPIMRGVTALRDWVSRSIFASMEPASAAFAQALVCGDKSDMDMVTKTKLYRAGVGHLFAMSGTHLAVIALVFGSIFQTLIRDRRARIAALEAVVLLFMAMGGFSPSLVRAGIMVSLVNCSKLFHRRTDVLSSLGVCAVVMCGINPYVVMSASFICTFGCCFAIGAVAPRLTALVKDSRLSLIYIPLIDTAVILTVMMPVFALQFAEVSVIAPISNLIIVPIASAALTLMLPAVLLGGTTLPARLIFRLVDLLIRAVLRLTDFFASFSLAAVGSRKAWLILIGAAVMITALIIAVRKKRVRIFCITAAVVLAVMPAVLTVMNVLGRDRVRMKIFSDYRSMCAVVSSGGECVILDIGAKGGFAYGVQEYISYNGISHFRTAFVQSDLGADSYRDSIYPAAEEILTEYGFYSAPFTDGLTADCGAFTVSRTEAGFDVSAGGCVYSLSKNKIELSDGRYIPYEELKKYPEIILE
ncbi:MAG: ComEC/Rec2 family competence protein [Ruminococcus sp.]|nr:ComEC/Rec2 family competence protein [Ruminococcus sp.]